MDQLILNDKLRITCDDKFNLDIKLDDGAYSSEGWGIPMDTSITLSPDHIDQLYEYLKEYFTKRNKRT